MAPAAPPGSRRVGRPPGPAADPVERREELLDAAERGLRRLGPAASMDELAAEAGLTKPALYKYFGDRSGLGAALGERFAARLVAGVLTPPADLAVRGDPAAVVRDACDAFTAFIEADPHIYRFLVQHARSTPGRPRLLVDLAAHITRQLREVLVALGADPGPAPVWAYALIGSVFSAAEWWIDSRAVSREQFVEWIAELTWRGLSGALAPVAPY